MDAGHSVKKGATRIRMNKIDFLINFLFLFIAWALGQYCIRTVCSYLCCTVNSVAYNIYEKISPRSLAIELVEDVAYHCTCTGNNK